MVNFRAKARREAAIDRIPSEPERRGISQLTSL